MVPQNIWEGPLDESDQMIEQLKLGDHFLIVQASGPSQVGYAVVKNGIANIAWFDPHDDEIPEKYTPDIFEGVSENVPIEDLLVSDYYFRIQQFTKYDLT